MCLLRQHPSPPFHSVETTPPHALTDRYRLKVMNRKYSHALRGVYYKAHLGTVHKVRHAIFGQFLPPLSHFVTHPGTPPESTSHISDPLRFLVGLVKKSQTKVPCTNSISIVREGFAELVFVRSPWVTIHLLQQKVKHRFKFHVSYV